MAEDDDAPTLTGTNKTPPWLMRRHIKAFALDVMKRFPRSAGQTTEGYLIDARRHVEATLKSWGKEHKVGDEAAAYLAEHFSAGFTDASVEFRRIASTGDFHHVPAKSPVHDLPEGSDGQYSRGLE